MASCSQTYSLRNRSAGSQAFYERRLSKSELRYKKIQKRFRMGRAVAGHDRIDTFQDGKTVACLVVLALSGIPGSTLQATQDVLYRDYFYVLIVLVQREVESGRSPLASITPFSASQFGTTSPKALAGGGTGG